MDFDLHRAMLVNLHQSLQAERYHHPPVAVIAVVILPLQSDNLDQRWSAHGRSLVHVVYVPLMPTTVLRWIVAARAPIRHEARQPSRQAVKVEPGSQCGGRDARGGIFGVARGAGELPALPGRRTRRRGRMGVVAGFHRPGSVEVDPRRSFEGIAAFGKAQGGSRGGRRRRGRGLVTALAQSIRRW